MQMVLNIYRLKPLEEKVWGDINSGHSINAC